EAARAQNISMDDLLLMGRSELLDLLAQGPEEQDGEAVVSVPVPARYRNLFVQARRTVDVLTEAERGRLLGEAGEIVVLHHGRLPVDRATVSEQWRELYWDVVYAVAERLYQDRGLEGSEDGAGARELSSRLADALGTRSRQGGSPPG